MNSLRGSGASLLLTLSTSTTHHLLWRRSPRPRVLLPTFTYLTTKTSMTTPPRQRSIDVVVHPTTTTTTSSSSSRCCCFCSSLETPPPGNGRIVDNDNDNDMGEIKEAAKSLDIRVGLILKAWRHEEADTLYVEEVDVGEAEPRTICSGLVNYIPLQHLQDSKVVVLANLKPRNMRGVKSYGMLMAASDESHENVELLMPPESAIPGDRIWFGTPHGHDNDHLPPPATPNQIQKKKIWELLQPHLRTDESCTALLGDQHMHTSAGPVVCKSLKNAKIS